MNKKIFIPAGAMLLVAGIVIGCSLSGTAGTKIFGNAQSSPIAKNDETAKAADIQKAFSEVYGLYSDKVVFISTEQTVKLRRNPFFDDPFFGPFMGKQGKGGQTRKRQGLGTGFVISEDGYICTNYHVVDGVDKVTVKLGSKNYDAKVIGTDQRTDIALIKIDSPEKLNPAYLGNSDDVKIGDWAIAIGN
ncbi:MAG: trypsin-like peptidase domain-containing protein, partial [Spirochaetota bacterium]